MIVHAAAGLHGGIDIGQGGDAGRDDHRLALAGGVLDQGNVGDLEGGDLVEGDVESLQKIDGTGVEGGGEEDEPLLVCFCLDGGMPLPGGVCLLIELVQGGAIPESALIDLEILIVAIKGHGVGRIGLDLDGIGTTRLG